VSAAAKLCGFLILLVAVFAAAYATGAHLGPVTTGHFQQPSNEQPMNMNMGAGRLGPGRVPAGTPGRRR
jgi:hypothetical protein